MKVKDNQEITHEKLIDISLAVDAAPITLLCVVRTGVGSDYCRGKRILFHGAA